MSGKIIGVDIRGCTQGIQTGVGQYTRGLLQALWKYDSQNTYILFDNQWQDVMLPSWMIESRVPVVRSRYPNKVFAASTILLRHPKIDRIVQKHSQRLDYFFSPNIHVTRLSPGVKHILTVHDLSFEHYPEYFSCKQRLKHKMTQPRRQCLAAYCITTPSEYTKQDLIRTYGISSEKITVVSPGIDVPGVIDQQSIRRVKEHYTLPSQFILFFGSMEPRKNILSAIEAYHALNRPEYSLIIAGAPGWKNNAVRSAIDDTPGVRYIGYIAPEDKDALYHLARLCVYPSMYEGFGFPPLEAMAVGTPVIASHHSALPEVAGDAAYYINPRNVAELTHGLRCLLDDEALREWYKERGLTRAKQFLWKKSADTFLQCIT